LIRLPVGDPPHLQAAADDSHLREDTIESACVYQGHFLHVRNDSVRLPDGSTSRREYIVHPGAVMVVPILDDGQLVMERQWRYPLARVMLEFPAGKLEVGEPPLQCAMRELAEETGYRAKRWARAGILHNAIAYSNEGIEVWFAQDLLLGERRLDPGEFLDVVTVAPEALGKGIASGDVTDAKTLIGWMWLQNWRAGLWSLDWLTAEQALAHAGVQGTLA